MNKIHHKFLGLAGEVSHQTIESAKSKIIIYSSIYTGNGATGKKGSGSPMGEIFK